MIDVVALTDREAEAAGALLTARHRRATPSGVRCLPAAYEDPAHRTDLVGHCTRRVRRRRGGRRQRHAHRFPHVVRVAAGPTAHRWLDMRPSVLRSTPVHGHAIAQYADPHPVYAALFGHLAARALELGITDHVVHVPLGDPRDEAAWVTLGFGRTSSVAVRDLSPLDRPAAAGVTVRSATLDELDLVERLVNEEADPPCPQPDVPAPNVPRRAADAVRVPDRRQS